MTGTAPAVETAEPAPSFDETFRDQLGQLIAWRRDVRRFRSDPVEATLLDELLGLACLAPSVGNSQPWRFVSVEEPSRRAQVRQSFESCNAEALAGIAFAQDTPAEPKGSVVKDLIGNVDEATEPEKIPSTLEIPFLLKLANGSVDGTGDLGFDPLGLKEDPETFARRQVTEVKNGRLAMIAFVGIVVQAIVYRTGPVAALKDHVTDPFGCNMATNIMHIGSTF